MGEGGAPRRGKGKEGDETSALNISCEEGGSRPEGGTCLYSISNGKKKKKKENRFRQELLYTRIGKGRGEIRPPCLSLPII